MNEWTMTEEQAKRLQEIMQTGAGLEHQQLVLVKLAGAVQKAQADWWVETSLALGIPEEYRQRLMADTKDGKIRLMAPQPGTPTPGLVVPVRRG